MLSASSDDPATRVTSRQRAQLRIARAIRRLRRKVTVPIRAAAARRPAGDALAHRMENVARRISSAMKRVEHALLSAAAVGAATDVGHAGPVVALHSPLVLISQPGRSGGTLLLRLLDGHPQCLVVPHELGSMLPKARLLDRRDPYKTLTPRVLFRWWEKGVRIGKADLAGSRRRAEPFELPPALLRSTYEELVRTTPPHSDRELLDAYFSAYFNAWQATQVAADARWIVGFEPGGVANEARLTRFDENYPDGRLLSIVRDPWTWFASAQRWSIRFAQLDVALGYWRDSVESALAYRTAHPDRVLLLGFDDLLLRTRETMERVSVFLEIQFDEALLRPTLAGRPSDSNSSFPGQSTGISDAPVRDRRQVLSAEDDSLIEAIAGETWRRAVDQLD